MPERARRGFSLAELLVGLVVAGMVAGIAGRVLVAALREGGRRAGHITTQDNVRVGALVIANELRGLGFDSVPAAAGLGVGTGASSDILLARPGRIRYRATRGLGFICSVSGGQVLVSTGTWEAQRLPIGGVDSASVFVEGNPTISEDDAWVRGRIAALSGGTCPDGSAALALSVEWAPAVGAAALAAAGGPVQIFEIMELEYYRQDGKSWLGLRSVSRGETVQPLIGPLADSTALGRGFTLGYLGRDDAPAANPADVRTITVELIGVTEQPVRSAGVTLPRVDTLALRTRVVLRNMIRP